MLRLMLRLLQIIKKIRLLNNTGINIMLFYANSLINPPPYTIPLPLTGERDVSFWRYGVICFISFFYTRASNTVMMAFLFILTIMDYL